MVLVVYNMRREATRTLRSLAANFQRDMAEDDYEVLVVENGSSEPLDPDFVSGCGVNFRHLPVSEPTASPAGAANFGLRESRGVFAAVMIDGARLASPGLLANALRAARTHPRTVVMTTSWHLGPASQQQSILQGYTREREDALLDVIGWPDGDGYRLFEIAAPAQSAREGLLRLPGESNFLCLPRTMFLDELGGCDERFDLPGGGFVNQDLLRRACELPDSELVLLLGEATFHQLHGGISTNPDAATPASLGQRWHRQYEELRGKPLDKSTRLPRFFGGVPPALASAIERSARLSTVLDGTPDPAQRSELVQESMEQDAAARSEVQRWLLLDRILPIDPDPRADQEDFVRAGEKKDVDPRESRPASSWLTGWLPRRARQPARRKKTLLFCVNYQSMQGAHLKTRHYFEHARRSPDWEPQVFFQPGMVWDDDNPWRDVRAEATPEYHPEKAGALFISGSLNWLRLPAAQRGHWPSPVICTLQGFRHANPYKDRIKFLENRAVRICVSGQVRAAIEGTGRVRGPTFVIPNAIDLPVSGPGKAAPPDSIFIAGMKNPGLALELEAGLRAAGWQVSTVAGRVPRAEFIAGMRRAGAALFLPREREGFYLPALEAMALGTCVICPDVLGNRSFCQDGVNSLRPAYRKDALLAACARLREQTPAERERMLIKASATASAHTLAHERDKFLCLLNHLPELWRRS